MQSRQARQESFHCNARPKFIIGFDYAVTLSSPASFCVLFDIASELLMELKWLIVETNTKDYAIHHV